MKKRWLFIPVAGLLILGVILGGFLDLSINKAIFDQQNGFGLFMAAFSETPVYMFFGVIAYGFCYLAIKEYKKSSQRVILFFLAFALMVCCTYFQGKHIFDENAYYTTDTTTKIFGYIAGFGIGMLGMLLGYFLIGKKTCTNRQLLFILIALVIVLGAANGINNIIKTIVSRPRFRFIEVYHQDFTNWWEISKNKSIKNWSLDNIPGITKEEFKSFPSGHMANIMTLCYIVPMIKNINNRMKGREEVLFLLPLIWAILLAFTRMLLGAHYLSDVCFGSLISLGFIYISNEIYRYLLKRYDEPMPVEAN